MLLSKSGMGQLMKLKIYVSVDDAKATNYAEV